MNSQIQSTACMNETERELTKNYGCLCVNSTRRDTDFTQSCLRRVGRCLGLGFTIRWTVLRQGSSYYQIRECHLVPKKFHWNGPFGWPSPTNIRIFWAHPSMQTSFDFVKFECQLLFHCNYIIKNIFYSIQTRKEKKKKFYLGFKGFPC